MINYHVSNEKKTKAATIRLCLDLELVDKMKGKKLYERYKTHPLFSLPKAFPSTNTFTDHNFQTQPLYIFLSRQSAQLLDCKQPNIYMPHILQNNKIKLKTIKEVIRLKELTLYLLFLPNNGKNGAGRG